MEGIPGSFVDREGFENTPFACGQLLLRLVFISTRLVVRPLFTVVLVLVLAIVKVLSLLFLLVVQECEVHETLLEMIEELLIVGVG